MPGSIFLSGERIDLRTIEEDDIPFLQRWRNHPDVRVPLTDTDPRNAAQMEEMFEEGISDDGGVNLLISVDCEQAEPTEATPDDASYVPVGEVAIPWIRERHGVGMLMYWVAPEHQGNGYVTEATELILDHAFRERRLAKVWAHVIEPNAGSQHVLEKLGFEKEGHLREHVFIDGERVDVIAYGLLADDWLSQR